MTGCFGLEVSCLAHSRFGCIVEKVVNLAEGLGLNYSFGGRQFGIHFASV
jgi:hypothetical protein